MARKSRRNQVGVSEGVENSNGPASAQTLATAAYARLSVENGGKETDESLQTQITLLHQYITENPLLKLADTYADNGFSGTTFDRPAFVRLMDDVRSGKIQCIVVKDLSRFGRNYVETGYYIETLLPHLNVRLIAINDDFDSSREEDRNSIAVPIKNMVNAMYAKDFSRKLSVAAAMRRKKENIVPNGTAPYGYAISPDRTHYIEDDTTAVYARTIFQMARMGVKQAEIARRMNFIGAVTPGAQRLMRDEKTHENCVEWTWCTIGHILRNSTYVGDTAFGKTRSALYKSELPHKTAPEEWAVREGTHLPLITKEDYAILQKSRADWGKKLGEGTVDCKKYREQMPENFRGKIYCAECKHKMYFVRYQHDYVTNEKAVPCYVCKSVHDKCACGGKIVYEDFLKIVVMDQIRYFIQSVCERRTIFEASCKGQNARNPLYALQMQKRALEQKRLQTEERQAALYENYAEGILEKEDFQMLKETGTLALKKLATETEKLDATARRTEKRIQEFIALADQLTGGQHGTEFDRQLVESLVERIVISNGSKIEIVFQCEDAYQEIVKMTGGE